MEEEVEISLALYNLMDDDSRNFFELSLLAFNLRNNLWCVGLFLSILKKI
jgi:hypothetical protein